MEHGRTAGGGRGCGLPLVALAGAGAVFEGWYGYMKELPVLDSCRPGVSEIVPDTMQVALAAVRTPLRMVEWERALRGHPDREFVDCSLTYASVDAAAAIVLAVGCGAVLVKLDIASAYRIVPVHPDDRPLLGMRWNRSLYVDTAPPFGLRSAPNLFTAVADGLKWILKDNGGYSVRYTAWTTTCLWAPRAQASAGNLYEKPRACARG